MWACSSTAWACSSTVGMLKCCVDMPVLNVRSAGGVLSQEVCVCVNVKCAGVVLSQKASLRILRVGQNHTVLGIYGVCT